MVNILVKTHTFNMEIECLFLNLNLTQLLPILAHVQGEIDLQPSWSDFTCSFIKPASHAWVSLPTPPLLAPLCFSADQAIYPN